MEDNTSVVSNWGPGGQKWPQRIWKLAHTGLSDLVGSPQVGSTPSEFTQDKSFSQHFLARIRKFRALRAQTLLEDIFSYLHGSVPCIEGTFAGHYGSEQPPPALRKQREQRTCGGDNF